MQKITHLTSSSLKELPKHTNAQGLERDTDIMIKGPKRALDIKNYHALGRVRKLL